MYNQHKKTIMIDLDGVLNNYTKYTPDFIPEIKQGAKEFLKKLYNTQKYELVLFTTRENQLAQNWLTDNKIDKYFSDITNIKKPASIYLDDRGMCFLGDYGKTFNDIEKFQVYWK